MSRIVVIDYKKGGNVFSVANSLENIGLDFIVSSDKEVISAADKLIFPGVGSFQTAVDQLEKLDLKKTIIEKINSNTPFLGICVGMQVLFETGLEDGEHNGLGVIPGTVAKFHEDAGHKIPQIGWNQVHNSNPKNPLFKGIENDSYFYFVHSYRVAESETKKIENKFPDFSAALTEYGDKFISSFWNGKNLFATQFHPEKSGEKGLKLLENFLKL